MDWLSLILPPTPVAAPGKGAIPVGKLWVSAVKVTWYFLVVSLLLIIVCISAPWIALELSENAIIELDSLGR